METQTTVALRRQDFDVLGHVHQAAFHVFLGEARATHFAALEEFAFVVARVEMDFRAEVTRDSAFVEVAMRTEAIGRSSLTIAHEVRLPAGVLAAEGRAVVVAWDRDRRCSRVLSAEQRLVLRG